MVGGGGGGGVKNLEVPLCNYLLLVLTCAPEVGEELPPAHVGEHHVEEAAVLVAPAQVHQERVVDLLIPTRRGGTLTNRPVGEMLVQDVVDRGKCGANGRQCLPCPNSEHSKNMYITQYFESRFAGSGSEYRLLGESGSGSRSRVLMTKNSKNLQMYKNIYFFYKKYYISIIRPP